MLPRPAYIPESISSDKLTYEWDEHDPYAPIGAGDEATFWLLDRLAPGFSVAYSLVTAEWCVYRFPDIAAEAEVQAFLKCSWQALDFQGALPGESNEDDWQGPKRMAVDIALMNVLNAFYMCEEETPSNIAAFNESLAAYVLPRSAEFTAWSDQLKGRLSELSDKTKFTPELFKKLLL